MPAVLRQVLCLTVFAVCASAQTQVTLSTAVTPTSGQPGITSITLTGSNFPAGTILPASVTVSMSLATGGAVFRTPATTVTPVVGTTSRVAFIIPATIIVATPASYVVSIAGATTAGTTFTSNQVPLTVNPGPSIASIVPNSAQLGQTVTVTITGTLTNFVQQSTVATFGAGVSVAGQPDGQPGIVTVTSPTTGTVQVKPDTAATPGLRAVTVQTGTQIATAPTGFTVTAPPPPAITSFTPQSGTIGALVTINGSNLGSSPQVSLPNLNGGSISLPLQSVSASSVGVVIPIGAATGRITVANAGGSAATASSFTVNAASSFSLSASPASATLIQGQSVSYLVQLTSANGFDQLAPLSVTGLPAVITASLKPSSITAGQTSVLTLTAPANQPVVSANISISAAATVAGIQQTQSVQVALVVTAPTTTLLGRTVVSDSLETPIAGVTITTLGADGNGNTTGCNGYATVSDSAGNFILSNLPLACTGPQLINFNGSTATSPPGKYDGVNLAFTLTSGTVTASPVLVHLPRIDTAEVFYVQQNAAANQTHYFSSIPGLSVTVYAGTTLTLPGGSQPNPFPISVVQVPPDRLPDLKPVVPTMVGVFYLSFQPTGTHASQPVAVTYPNTLNTPAGADMPLMVLDATHGSFTPIGTGKVSANGAVIVPDLDPAHPGHAYGITNFDW